MLDSFLVEILLRMIPFQRFQVVPLARIEEVHEVEELAHVVVQRSLVKVLGQPKQTD